MLYKFDSIPAEIETNLDLRPVRTYDKMVMESREGMTAAYFFNERFRVEIFSSCSFERKEKRSRRCLTMTSSHSSQKVVTSTANRLNPFTKSRVLSLSFARNWKS